MRPLRPWLLAIVLLLAYGCGASAALFPGPDDLEVTAGQRLRPIVARADGVAVFLGWHDTLLDVDCGFRLGADLEWRCLPVVWRVVFLDAACEQPALRLGECGHDDRYGGLATDPEDRCIGGIGDAFHQLYERQPGIVEATTYYDVDRTGVCTATPVDLEPDEILVPAAPVPMETFVRSEPTVVGTGRLRRVEHVAEDGAREPIAGYDTDLAQACIPSSFGPWALDAEIRCVPERPSYGSSRFVDASCTQPAASATCGETVLEEHDAETCTRRFFALGAPTTSSYEVDGGTCQAVSDLAVAAIGEELPASSFPPVSLTTKGDERLQVRSYTGNGVSIGQPQRRSLFDRELDTDCEPAALEGGGYRCVPRASARAKAFADEACTEPVIVTRTNACGDGNPFTYVWERPEPRVCGFPATGLVFRRVLDPLTATTVHTLDDQGGCLPRPLEADEVAQSLAAPELADAFPEVTVAIE
ncbi:MAG: hypothetical protein R3B72_08975 [Polyangiaceae bacterium]